MTAVNVIRIPATTCNKYPLFNFKTIFNILSWRHYFIFNIWLWHHYFIFNIWLWCHFLIHVINIWLRRYYFIYNFWLWRHYFIFNKWLLMTVQNVIMCHLKKKSIIEVSMKIDNKSKSILMFAKSRISSFSIVKVTVRSITIYKMASNTSTIVRFYRFSLQTLSVSLKLSRSYFPEYNWWSV